MTDDGPQTALIDADQDPGTQHNNNDSSDEDEPLKYTEGDELFDETLDDADEVFVNEHYRGVRAKARGSEKTAPAPSTAVPPSDAQLSCPACFDTVCIECQQHIRYQKQFRAVNVMNIKVAAREGTNQEAKVSCECCGTEVGILDSDEIYHFYNVLASQ